MLCFDLQVRAETEPAKRRRSWRVWRPRQFGRRVVGEDLVDAGEDVVATYHVRGRGREGGVSVKQRIALVWSAQGGKVARVRAYRERAHALGSAGLIEN